MPGSGLLGALRARPRLLAASFGALLVIGFAGAGAAVGSFQAVCRDCPSIAQISVWEPQQSTRLFAHDGRLIQELFLERRTPVSLSQLPPHVPMAFVAVEDKRFYSHSGLDFIRIAGAAVGNVLSGRVTGGASTITQQLARNIFAADIDWIDEIQGEVTFWQRVRRKLKEVHVALQLEQVYTKDQILEAYLNQIHYGHGWYGIETASGRYFGKSASELTPAEAATLAAVVKLWGQYSPFRNPDQALARRNMVLRLMGNQRVIPEQEVAQWQAEPLPEQPHGVGEGDLAPYFVEWVRSILDERYGYDLYSSGLRVYTTLDLDMQRRAVTAMEAGWNRIESVPGYRHPKYDDVLADTSRVRGTESPYVQGMFVALDPHSGAVRALIGGRDFNDSRFNRAVQALRQPGSAFKPFVYTAALASGVPASHVIFDTPIGIEQVDGTVWSPSNYTPEFKGPMTLREALRESTNVVAVKLGLEIGLETVAQYARRMGIQTEIPRVPSMSLGVPDVIPIQLLEGYTAFPTGGVRVRPHPIVRVEDAEGRVLWEPQPDSSRVLDPVTAALARDLLEDVINNGTGRNVRNPAVGNLPPEVPAGGKTGTTSDATDVWFVGFTPDLVAGVWFGFDRPTPITSTATGGGFAAPVWGEFMRSVYYGEPPLLEIPEPWVLPEAVRLHRVDSETGMLANEWCPATHVYTEKFAPGTVPSGVCDLHGPGGLRGAPLRGLFETLPEALPNDTVEGGPANSPADPTNPETAIPPGFPPLN